MSGEAIKKSVREHYAAIARSGSSCCGPAAGGELRPITRKPASPRTPAGPAPPSLAYPIPPADPPSRIRQTDTARPLHP